MKFICKASKQSGVYFETSELQAFLGAHLIGPAGSVPISSPRLVKYLFVVQCFKFKLTSVNHEFEDVPTHYGIILKPKKLKTLKKVILKLLSQAHANNFSLMCCPDVFLVAKSCNTYFLVYNRP